MTHLEPPTVCHVSEWDGVGWVWWCGGCAGGSAPHHHGL